MCFYEGVLELCLTAAEKKDPQGLGPHFYKNGEPEDDSAGHLAFQERCSQITFDHLFRVLHRSIGHLSSNGLTLFLRNVKCIGCP